MSRPRSRRRRRARRRTSPSSCRSSACSARHGPGQGPRRGQAAARRGVGEETGRGARAREALGRAARLREDAAEAAEVRREAASTAEAEAATAAEAAAERTEGAARTARPTAPRTARRPRPLSRPRGRAATYATFRARPRQDPAERRPSRRCGAAGLRRVVRARVVHGRADRAKVAAALAEARPLSARARRTSCPTTPAGRAAPGVTSGGQGGGRGGAGRPRHRRHAAKLGAWVMALAALWDPVKRRSRPLTRPRPPRRGTIERSPPCTGREGGWRV